MDGRLVSSFDTALGRYSQGLGSSTMELATSTRMIRSGSQCELLKGSLFDLS